MMMIVGRSQRGAARKQFIFLFIFDFLIFWGFFNRWCVSGVCREKAGLLVKLVRVMGAVPGLFLPNQMCATTVSVEQCCAGWESS